MLLPVKIPNPSLALSAMGFTTVGPCPSPGMIEELFPVLWKVWTLVARTRLPGPSWPGSLTPMVVAVAPASISGGMKELSWAP